MSKEIFTGQTLDAISCKKRNTRHGYFLFLKWSRTRNIGYKYVSSLQKFFFHLSLENLATLFFQMRQYSKQWSNRDNFAESSWWPNSILLGIKRFFFYTIIYFPSSYTLILDKRIWLSEDKILSMQILISQQGVL